MADKGITILYDDAVLIARSHQGKFICIADIHLGYSPSISPTLDSRRSTAMLADKIVEISKKAKVDNLILLGDVKHSIARITYLDRLSLSLFFKKLLPSFRSIVLVMGNHDGSINRMLPPSVKLVKRGVLIDGTYFMHGHTLPGPDALKSNLIIMGHLHPIFYKDHSPLNGQRVWLLMSLFLRKIFPQRAKSCKLIVMPPFNPEISFQLNFSYSPSFSSRISPLLNKCKEDISSMKVISLDGTLLTQT